MRFQYIAEFFDLSIKLRHKIPSWTSGFQQQSRPVQPADFDSHSEERQFWNERRQETLHTLKVALLLGSLGFLIFIILDLYIGSLNISDLPKRSMVIFLLLGLLVWLQLSTDPCPKIPTIAKLGASLALLNLLGILWTEHNPQYYPETWASALPIYFFTYGQMFMTLGESLIFGMTAMLTLPLAGYLIGMGFLDLLPSIALMAIINVFGYCTRWQLENQTRKLFKARRMAEMAAHDKVIFLRQIGHNLRQPLQALGCYASVLEAHYASSPNNAMRSLVGKMAMTIDEVNNTCNRVLDIANIELGKQLPMISSVDINTLLAALELQFLPTAAKRGLKLKVSLRSNPPYVVHTDASILTQIIGNLLDNAIKFTQNGWIIVKAVKIDSKQLKLHVIDSGPGIEARQQQIIFSDDHHGHRRCHEHHIDGFGIGLAFVGKAIKQLPHHRLDLYSKFGHGCDFQIYLPVADTATPNTKSAVVVEPGLVGLLVFIVDDDITVLNALGEYFRNRSCEVEIATSKADAQLALRDCLRQPDLLVTDYYLSKGETAHDIIALVEAECGPVPTLILSAYAICDEVKNKLAVNVGLLRKPANPAMLMDAIAKLLKLERTA